jgi:hypothetical protein
MLSLLAFLLLVLSVQAAAGGGDKDGDDRDDDGKGDGKHGAKHTDKDRDREGRGDGGRGDRDERKGDRRDRAADADLPRADLPRDARLQVLPMVLPGRVGFTFLVTTTAAFEGVTLAAELPDIDGAWTISGPGADGCDLAGDDLSCSFEGPAAGATQVVRLSAPARASPWELVADATLSAGEGGDAVPGNDQGSARIGLFLS